jgi:hypothetical protein
MSNNSLFTEKSIVFDDRSLDKENISGLKEIYTNDCNFGILKLTAISAPLSKEIFEILFMVDCSGSMSDDCSDGRSKMQHIRHTLSNMVLYFKNNQAINAFITIHAFDDKIYNIVDRCKITADNIQEIQTKISLITPRDCTNIELALQDINSTVETIRSSYENHEIVSIFMTDGEVSTGRNEVGYLSELVNRSINNYFVGFGVDHDAVLLNTLGNSTKSSYHFIDKIENSGFVYGEILHGIVYKLLFNVQIEMTNGLIYDYKNNKWVSCLNIGNIVSEMNKIYHIVSDNAGLCHLLVKADQKIYDENGIEAIMSHGYSVFNEGATEGLDKYIFRQRTMQLLYNVNSHNQQNKRKENVFNWIGRNRRMNKFSNPDNDDNSYLKEHMNELLTEMKKFMTDNNLEQDKLMKNLCDDIYISLRTFGTRYSAMYSCARQTSQGSQRCYTVNHTPEDNDVEPGLRRFPLTRQTNKIYSSTDDLLEEHNSNDITQHQVSGLEDSPFLSPSAAQVMRDISTIRNKEEEEELMEETD